MAENYFQYLFKRDLQQNVTSNAVFTVCLALSVTLLVVFLKIRKKNNYKLPPGPTGVPILGYLPFLGEEPHKELHRLKEIYGNVFSLYMGLNYVVILGDNEAVKEAFSKSTTTDRPDSVFSIVPDGVGFSSVNGQEWVEQRKFCVKSMKDYGIGQKNWESLIQMEVCDFINAVSSHSGRPFDITNILTSSVSNNISAFVFGRRLSRDDPDRIFLDKEMDEIMQHLGVSSVITAFPVVRDLLVALGIGRLAEAHKKMKAFNNFFRKEVEKLRKCYKAEGQNNFIVDYLTEMDNQKGKTGHYFNEKNLLGNIQALFLAGSDTTRTSIYWLIIMMANFPDIQSRVQEEIDSVLGENGVQWSDRKKLPYTIATIWEGQRWRTIAPLNTTRVAMEDIQIQNYDIPKGTSIIANNWGLHNDPKYWKEPDKFNPERFLTNNGKEIISKPESFVPWSYGKRNCPGEVISTMEILIYFTALLQKFTISAPEGTKVNLDGKLGLTYQAYPQKFRFIPREHGGVASYNSNG